MIRITVLNGRPYATGAIIDLPGPRTLHVWLAVHQVDGRTQLYCTPA